VLNKQRFLKENRLSSEQMVLPADTDAFGGLPKTLDFRASELPSYQRQLEALASLGNEFAAVGKCIALLHQLDESQLSSVLEFLQSLQTKKTEACHEHD